MNVNPVVPSFCGLWSKDNGFALPFTPRTDRESPALAYVVSMNDHMIIILQTYNVDLLVRDNADRCSAARNLIFVPRVCTDLSASDSKY